MSNYWADLLYIHHRNVRRLFFSLIPFQTQSQPRFVWQIAKLSSWYSQWSQSKCLKAVYYWVVGINHLTCRIRARWFDFVLMSEAKPERHSVALKIFCYKHHAVIKSLQPYWPPPFIAPAFILPISTSLSDPCSTHWLTPSPLQCPGPADYVPADDSQADVWALSWLRGGFQHQLEWRKGSSYTGGLAEEIRRGMKPNT